MCFVESLEEADAKAMRRTAAIFMKDNPRAHSVGVPEGKLQMHNWESNKQRRNCMLCVSTNLLEK